jgi:hypothetical protein
VLRRRRGAGGGRGAGQDSDARKFAVARRSDLRKFGNLGLYHKVGSWLLDKFIKYGYQTWRAVAGLAMLYVTVLGLSISPSSMA